MNRKVAVVNVLTKFSRHRIPAGYCKL